MAFISLYVKKSLRLDRLNFKQAQMQKIGQAAVDSLKQRLAAAYGPTDAPAKPLKRGYAIYKTKKGLGNRRNLTLTGGMLDNFSLRTVSENRAKARNTTRLGRIKALANQQKEPWVIFSPKNEMRTIKAVQGELQILKNRLIVEKAFGGRQR